MIEPSSSHHSIFVILLIALSSHSISARIARAFIGSVVIFIVHMVFSELLFCMTNILSIDDQNSFKEMIVGTSVGSTIRDDCSSSFPLSPYIHRGLQNLRSFFASSTTIGLLLVFFSFLISRIHRTSTGDIFIGISEVFPSRSFVEYVPRILYGFIVSKVHIIHFSSAGFDPPTTDVPSLQMAPSKLMLYCVISTKLLFDT